jgi:hypothetical protein
MAVESSRAVAVSEYEIFTHQQKYMKNCTSFD